MNVAELEPTFDYVGHSDRVSKYFLRTLRDCAAVQIDLWTDKGVTEAFATHKVSVECFDANGRRIDGQKLFKLGTVDAQIALAAYLNKQRGL
jgi:hypothetical protein